jgi:2-polyprenyl-6-methoxyphenol hydroxylase-like FAD-dependent oxidoreductase
VSPPVWDVLIAGAGVGGAALAAALSLQPGLRVLVVDRRSGPGNINRGDSLLPAVTCHLQRWGVMPAVWAAGARAVTRMQICHHRDGLLFEAPLSGTVAAPYVVLPHPEIERALVETARQRGVEVRYRCRLARLRTAAGRVTGAELVAEGGAAEPVTARVVVGADGSASTVRAQLGLGLPLSAYDHGYYITEVARPADYQDAMRIELHPAGGILVVPQGDERVGLGVLVRPAHEALFRAGPLADKLAEIGRRSPLLAGRIAYPRGAHLYALQRGHAPVYTTAGAVLIGDAIHITNPTAGQGMTMALEDAEALSRHLVPVLTQAPDPVALDAALHAYAAERWPRNDAQIRWSHWLSRLYALGPPAGDLLHRGALRLGGSRLGRSLQDFIWSRMATRS